VILVVVMIDDRPPGHALPVAEHVQVDLSDIDVLKPDKLSNHSGRVIAFDSQLPAAQW
jgi:hypothetical protein